MPTRCERATTYSPSCREVLASRKAVICIGVLLSRSVVTLGPGRPGIGTVVPNTA